MNRMSDSSEVTGQSMILYNLPSQEHEASKVPNFGCAQATCQTGPSWPVRVAELRNLSPVVSNILIDRSEEHVAKRLA